METTQVAQMTYLYTRQAEALAPLFRCGEINAADEHRLLEAVEQIADMTERPRRVVWLELVEGRLNADADYKAEQLATVQRRKATATEKEAALRAQALEIIGMSQ